jgi:hypothetical protein
MRLRQPVARQIHEQMMLGVIVDPVGRDQQPLDWVGASGAGVAERVFAGRGAGVLGDVADAVTNGSQVAIASTQTPQNQMPALASQNRPNSTALAQRKRAIFSAPLLTKL